MDHSIYSYSLCIALPLMLFFGFYLLFGRTPDKAFSVIIFVRVALWVQLFLCLPSIIPYISFLE